MLGADVAVIECRGCRAATCRDKVPVSLDRTRMKRQRTWAFSGEAGVRLAMVG